MRRAPRLATLATLLWLIGGCHSDRVTRREPPLRRAKPECPAPSGDECGIVGRPVARRPDRPKASARPCSMTCAALIARRRAAKRPRLSNGTSRNRSGSSSQRQRPACGIRGTPALARADAASVERSHARKPLTIEIDIERTRFGLMRGDITQQEVERSSMPRIRRYSAEEASTERSTEWAVRRFSPSAARSSRRRAAARPDRR
jgi:hypothetical protein